MRLFSWIQGELDDNDIIVNDAHRLTSAKIHGIVKRAVGFFNLRRPEEDWYENSGHDMAVRIAANNLKGGSFEILDAADASVVAWAWDFVIGSDGNASKNVLTEPRLQPLLGRAGDWRFLIRRRRGNDDPYAHMLKMSWGPADMTKRQTGNISRDNETACATGGRVNASTFTADANKVDITIDFIYPDKGYGFASTPLGLSHIYLDRRDFIIPLTWSKFRSLGAGTKLKALLLPKHRNDGTPGLAAKAVEIAA